MTDRQIIQELLDYTEHETRCIRASWCAGRPTEGHGYEEKFGDVWYQVKPVDKTPKCNCGLDDLIGELHGNGIL